MRENKFKANLKKELQEMFPGCVLFDNDAGQFQGMSDLLILYKNTWAALECKRNSTASHRPNQDYYVNMLNDMSYAAFICPENKEDILDDLEHALNYSRGARIS